MTTPAPETIALSASIFTSSIDSWIPAKFGPKQTDAERNAQFDKRLREAALQGEHEKLGVGHPDIGVYKPKGPSLSMLEKKLGKVERNGKKAEVEHVTKEASDEEEEESRSRSIPTKKRSNAVHDLLMGKKKAKAKMVSEEKPLLNLTPHPSASTNPSPQDEQEEPVDGMQTPPTAATSSPGGSGVFPFVGPVSLDSPQAQRVLDEKLFKKRIRNDGTQSPRDGSEDEEAKVDIPTGSQGKSKSARKKEKRRAKMAKMNNE